jgi:hypothetical protein
VLTSSVSAASWNKIQEVDVGIQQPTWIQIQHVEVNIKPAAWYQIQVVEVELKQGQWVLVQTVEVELEKGKWVLVQTVEVVIEVELEQAQWVLVQTVEVRLGQAKWYPIQIIDVNIVSPSGPLVWTGAGDDNLASNPENWNYGVTPYNGADVVFDGTSVKDCTWDLPDWLVMVNSLTLATGYTGTVTIDDPNIDVNIGSGGLHLYGGIFTTSANLARSKSIVHCHGDVVVDGSRIANDRIRLYLYDDITLSISNTLNRFQQVVNHGNLTVIGAVQTALNHGSNTNFINHGTIDLRGSIYYGISPNFGGFVNTGNIYGGNIIGRCFNNADMEIEIGSTTSNIRFIESSANLERCNIIHSGVSEFSSMSIEHVGISFSGSGTLINHGNLDSSAGQFDFAGQYVQAGNGIIKLGSGQKINDLTVYAPVRLTLGSDLTVQGEVVGIKNIALNGYRIILNSVTHLGEYQSEFYVSEPVFIPIKTPIRDGLIVYGDIPRWMKYDSQKGGLYGVPVGTGLYDFNISCYSEYTDLVSLRISFAVLEQTIQKDDFRGQSIGSIISIILSIIVIGMCGITRGPDGKMDYQISNVLLGGAVVVSVLVFASVIPSYGLVIVAFLLFALYWGGRR